MIQSAEDADLLARATSGDETAFETLVGPQERAIFRHCYRMLGSGADAEDATQDTLVRAWRSLDGYAGSGAFAGWLFRIATNVCLDALRSRKARVDPISLGPPSPAGTMPSAPDVELTWVEPVSDQALGIAEDPQDLVQRHEDVSLAFVAALQRLAPRQRAALLLHDVIGLDHDEVGKFLGTSSSAVNSLLSRARETTKSSQQADTLPVTDPDVAEFLGRYVGAWRSADINAFVELVGEDVHLSMPPMSTWYEGRDSVAAFVEAAIFAPARPYGVSIVPGMCNGQPSFAVYQPDANGTLAIGGLQVLLLNRLANNYEIIDIVSHRDPALALKCGYPATLSE